MKLSEARRQAIYGAVHDVMMDARVALEHQVEAARMRGQRLSHNDYDAAISLATDKAGQAAIKAAEKVMRR